MKTKKMIAVAGLTLITGLLVSCSTITTHYSDERADYNGKATIQDMDTKTKTKLKKSSSTSKRTNTTTYTVTLCPEESSGIPCYDHKVTKTEYNDLKIGDVIQLEKGNLVTNDK